MPHLGQGDIAEFNHVSDLEGQVLHHPMGKVHDALLGHELKHPAMGGSPIPGLHLEEHWILNVQVSCM